MYAQVGGIVTEHVSLLHAWEGAWPRLNGGRGSGRPNLLQKAMLWDRVRAATRKQVGLHAAVKP
eukprot:2478943-Pyramimonas_sp.AAC.1